MTYFITRISVALIFLYHGVVPKLIYKNDQEILMNNTLMPFISEGSALFYSGLFEVVYSVALLVFYRSKLLMYPTIVFSIMVTLALIVKLPQLFQNAFNPLSINFAILILAILNIRELKNIKP